MIIIKWEFSYKTEREIVIFLIIYLLDLLFIIDDIQKEIHLK